VDPRFSRTSACCDLYVGIRAGADIAFLGGVINYVLTNERWFKEYVLAYTNAATIIEEGFEGAEDLDGLFSGYDREGRRYDAAEGRWAYEGSESATRAQGEKTTGAAGGTENTARRGVHGYGLMGGGTSTATKRSALTTAEPKTDPTLQHPRCVMQLLRRHFARYTPETVSQICGCTPQEMIRVAELLCQNSGRERTSAIVYAVGWTQHSTGPQIIRAAAILQLLLGNVGRPGGMVMAMRGHCSIQGSTDVSTLYDTLPGYLPQPTADEHHRTLDGYVEYEGLPTGYWANTRKFIVSQLKAWYGDAAQPENDFRFGWLPRIDGDYSHQVFFDRMAQGKVKGYFLFGQNPAGGGPNAGLHRKGLRELDWLVVADWFEIESAVFWRDDPTGPKASDVKTEVFFIPAASIACKDGTFTNTQRVLQWHDKAIDPEGDTRSDLWFVYQLGKRLKQLYAGSTKPQDQAIQAMTWDYEYDEHPRLADGRLSQLEGEPDPAKVLQEINGYYLDQKDEKSGKPKLIDGFKFLKDDGSTASGCWIYCGVCPGYDRNRSRDRTRTPDSHGVEPAWGYAWPMNRRVMYNRASADPDGKPWSERKRLVWWDEAQKKWQGHDVPDFEPDKPPTYRPPPGSTGMAAIGGNQPFIMKQDGVGWLFAPMMKDGPLPTHYEPVESPVRNLLYQKQNDSPVVRYFDQNPLNVLDRTPSDEFPIVATTFRLTEHYLSGPMSRFNSWLNELQPEMFVEVSPELAAERGIEHGAWVTVRSARGSIECKAMVTRRVKPLRVQGRTIHQIALPFHWGYAGEAVGAIANDLVSLTAEPNVSIQESKVFTCDVRPGRSGNSSQRPTTPYAHWPTREPMPQTPASAQPEGRVHP
jgi:formate dehydrogenase major subunit